MCNLSNDVSAFKNATHSLTYVLNGILSNPDTFGWRLHFIISNENERKIGEWKLRSKDFGIYIKSLLNTVLTYRQIVEIVHFDSGNDTLVLFNLIVFYVNCAKTKSWL